MPWTEIYRARHLNSYLGCHRKEIRRFNDWFHHWSRKLNNETEKPKSTRQGRKRRRVHDEDDDQSDEDFIEQSNLYYHQRSQSKEECPQIIFLHGCGTTSLVHALAEEHQFKVHFILFCFVFQHQLCLDHRNQWNTIKNSCNFIKTIRTKYESSLSFDKTLSIGHGDHTKIGKIKIEQCRSRKEKSEK